VRIGGLRRSGLAPASGVSCRHAPASQRTGRRRLRVRPPQHLDLLAVGKWQVGGQLHAPLDGCQHAVAILAQKGAVAAQCGTRTSGVIPALACWCRHSGALGGPGRQQEGPLGCSIPDLVRTGSRRPLPSRDTTLLGSSRGSANCLQKGVKQH
jgi:hypothetical protein